MMTSNLSDIATVISQQMGLPRRVRADGHNGTIQQGKSKTLGFTLVELLVGMVITSILLTFAGSGLISILQTHRQSEAELDQRVKLNRAVDFIADDIREAKVVSTTAPSGWIVPTNYTAILYLTKPDDSTVAYYTLSVSNGSDWQGPQVVYRATTSNTVGNPLVDRVANASPGCSGIATTGFEVFPSPLTASDRSVRLCLLGDLPNGTTYLVQSNVTLRSNDISPSP